MNCEDKTNPDRIISSLIVLYVLLFLFSVFYVLVSLSVIEWGEY